MRNFGRVEPSFWIGETGRQLRGHMEAQIVSAYLLSNPHANMLGLYYLPVAFLVHETGLTLEGALKGLARGEEVHFCAYSAQSEVVWVYEMARFQVGERLSPTDNRVKGVQTQYDNLPKNEFLPAFFDKYAEFYHMTNRRGFDTQNTSPSEAPSKPLRSQEQEQELEQKNTLVMVAPAGLPCASDLEKPKRTPVKLPDLEHWVGMVSQEWPRLHPDGKAAPYTPPSLIRKGLESACKRLKVSPEEIGYASAAYWSEMAKRGTYVQGAKAFLNGPVSDFIAPGRVMAAASRAADLANARGEVA